jgi:chemotaxis methyl-accepting protein methylase
MKEPLAALLAAVAGLDPPPWALEARVRERAATLQLSDDEYAAHVGDSPEELGRLIELLRVGETRFFRHRKQLEALAARVLPTLRAPVAAWSAGCASGEEAWTLAMLLSERGLAYSLSATDLSPTALARAREGRYATARVDGDVPAELVTRYFRRIGDECVLNDRLRPHVRFGTHNLLSGAQPRDLDLILCCNVLIYFDEARRAEAVARLIRALKPGGWLLVGYAETLRDCAELSAEAHAIYRKREVGAVKSVLPSPSPSPSPVTLPIAPTIAPTPTTKERRVMLKGEYHDGKRIAAELRAALADSRAIIDLDGASFLGDEAARVLRRAVEAAPGLEVKATRAPIRRWLQRHGLKPR